MDEDDINTYIVAEEDDDKHNIVIVSSTWLTPKKQEAFWPKVSQYNRYLTKHEKPDETWRLITLKRKFYETADLLTARVKSKQAETTSDLNDYDDNSKKRKTKKPSRVIHSDGSSSEPEEGALDMFIGNIASGSREKKKNDQNIEGIPCYNKFQSNGTPEKEVSLNRKPIDVRSSSTSADHRSRNNSTDTDITITPKSTGIHCYNKYQSNGTLEKEVSFNRKPIDVRSSSTSTDHRSRKHSTDTDITITPKSTGHQQKVMHLLTTLVEQNNQILTWIRSQNETDEIKRKKEPIKLPVQLPICDENELSTLEEYLNDDVNFGEMCNYLMSFCGISTTSSVNQIMRHMISNELASKFSYRGKKGKRPFEQLNLKLVVIPSISCQGQREPSLPLSPGSFRQILRSKVSVPEGRSINVNDVILRLYSPNTTKPVGYRIRETKRLLANPNFDPQRPTVIYAHGYVELFTDTSVQRVMQAYLDNGEYNAVLLDWSNLAFGNYVVSAIGLQAVGEDVGKAVAKLLKGGLKLEGLHLVGHSMGAQLLGITARYLAGKGTKVPRLTGLDPAYPGFYPPLLAPPLAPSDAALVDAVHTDGGGFGAPAATAAADFWPNEGKAKQPGCLSATVPLTVEDFCSHWRSWEYWAESVTGGEFLARKCADYDSFLRGQCRGEPTVYMGLKASPDLTGNFYLRTAAKAPFALGERGAD